MTNTIERYWFRVSPTTFAGLLSLAGLAGLTLTVLFVPGVSLFDQAVSSAIQSLRVPAMDTLMVRLTSLGDTRALLMVAALVCIVLLVSKMWRAALISVATFASTSLLVTAIKSLVHRARPLVDLYPGVEAFSFPSGHMTNAVVIYGSLALLYRFSVCGSFRKLLWAAIVGLVILIGFSRIYLGAHWPSDVFGAALLGLSILALMSKLLPNEQSLLPSARSLGVVLSLTGLLWAFHLGSRLADNSRLYDPRPPTHQKPIVSGSLSAPGDTTHADT